MASDCKHPSASNEHCVERTARRVRGGTSRRHHTEVWSEIVSTWPYTRVEQTRECEDLGAEDTGRWVWHRAVTQRSRGVRERGGDPGLGARIAEGRVGLCFAHLDLDAVPRPHKRIVVPEDGKRP